MKLSSSKPARPQLSRAEALACVPVVNPSVHASRSESGEVLLEYPLVVKPLLAAIFKRFNRTGEETLSRKLQLDAHGSRVWASIDGRNSVAEIVTRFAKATSITTREAELSVTAFLRELGKRGIIILQ